MYSQHMLARVEYDRMINAVPSVSEYGDNTGTQRRPLNWLRAAFLSVLHLVVR